LKPQSNVNCLPQLLTLLLASGVFLGLLGF
jgi:hypothetical protein